MTANHAQQIVQKLWNYCNVLRGDSLSSGTPRTPGVVGQTISI
jgi:hypothetical protein